MSERTPLEMAGQKITWFGEDAPLLLEEAAAILEMSTDSFERQHIPPCELGARSRRWLWGTIRTHLRNRVAKEAA